MPGEEESVGAPRDATRLLHALCAIQILLGIGGSAIIPLLPTYLVSHGSTPAGVGLVMGSFFLAELVSQYPAGRLVDRVGVRPVVAVGLVIFAVGCVGFAFEHNPAVAIGFRVLQGIGDGAVSVASASAIGARTRAADRGRAFSLFGASTMLAFAIGPIIGGAVGSSSIAALFLAGAAVSLIAVSVTPRLPATPPRRGGGGVGATPLGTKPQRPRVVNRALVGASLALGATGLVGGLYDGVWSLLLHSRGVSSFGIASSWTLYCLPYAAASPFAGRLVSRADRRVLACAGIVSSAVFASIYPAIGSGTVLIFVGAAEAFTAVAVIPSAQAVLADHVTGDLHGRAQGIAGSVRTGAMAVGAIGSGALFGVGHSAPFHAVSVALMLTALGAAVAWRGVGQRRDRVAPAAAVAPIGPPA